jgi:membrane protein required for colicin V production
VIGDLVLILLLAGGFLLGFFRGSVRQLLSIGAWLVTFLLAAHLGQFVGRLLFEGFTSDYAVMVGFGLVFTVLFVGSVVVFQLSGQAISLSRHELLDDLVGGLLGMALVLLAAASVLVILDTFYARPDLPAGPQIALLATLFNELEQSAIATGLRDSLIPLLGMLLRPLLPPYVAVVMT